uniref:Uncharacterized protein n=1 Tax=Candidatus Kentrum sp. LFY TaxID=2126342 RepID=A0A450VCB0_9GAMM|nr:MAG: hypothetical protein BECKLFY1418A_GA0070994_11963 [Candidatus Kentron sp. LFY]
MFLGALLLIQSEAAPSEDIGVSGNQTQQQRQKTGNRIGLIRDLISLIEEEQKREEEREKQRAIDWAVRETLQRETDKRQNVRRLFTECRDIYLHIHESDPPLPDISRAQLNLGTPNTKTNTAVIEIANALSRAKFLIENPEQRIYIGQTVSLDNLMFRAWALAEKGEEFLIEIQNGVNTEVIHVCEKVLYHLLKDKNGESGQNIQPNDGIPHPRENAGADRW